MAKRRVIDQNQSQPSINVEIIQRRAYEIYESRGRRDGAALDDWLQAEHELLDAVQRQPSTAEGRSM